MYDENSAYRDDSVVDRSGLNKPLIRKTIEVMRRAGANQGKVDEWRTSLGFRHTLGFDMQAYYCGTSACLAGWIYGTRYGFDELPDAIGIGVLAAHALGLGFESNTLFGSYWRPATLNDGTAMLEWLETLNHKPTRNEVQDRWLWQLDMVMVMNAAGYVYPIPREEVTAVTSAPREAIIA